MFRTQANPMDEPVAKATDENLTSENWEYILDVCDKVSASASGPQQVVASLIRRLAHRNANVQLYTLELAHALSQNCGIALHRELASKAFTEALLRLAENRTTHGQVKQKVLERMGVWADEFRSNPELGFMESAYQNLRTQQPGLHPPSKPTKTEISSEDRRKEEEELQMALALSIKEKGAATSVTGNQVVRDDSEPRPAQPQLANQQGTTAATVSRVRALYDFTPSEGDELAFRKGDIIAVLESVYKDWWRGSLRGQSGIFPLNYVEKLADPTKDELERDAQMEAEVFGEIKNVERLLALLSVRSEGGGRRGSREEDEITDLYQRTLSIRPKLIELIGKYSQKKDDFTQLNEKFIKARRDYEALLESSMSQPQYPQQYPIRNRQPSYPPHVPYGHPAQPLSSAYHGASASPAHPPFPAQAPYTQPNAPSHIPSQTPQRFSSVPPGLPETNASSHAGYNSPYGPNGVPQPVNAPAPFHFIPGGIQSQPQAHDIRRKPSPSGPPGASPTEPYGAPVGFQGPVHPSSVHALNSGNPQELATSGYEPSVDSRQGYPPASMDPTAFNPTSNPHHDHHYNYDSQPNHTFPAKDASVGVAPDPYAVQHPIHAPPSAPPPGPPGPSSPDGALSGGQLPPQGYASYQAYQPIGQHMPNTSAPGVPSSGGPDPGDFYR